MNHIHFTDPNQIIRATCEMLANAWDASCQQVASKVKVAGTKISLSHVPAVDWVVKVAARELYISSLKSNASEEELGCASCKDYFLKKIKDHEVEISLRVMHMLKEKKLLTSCEYIGYNNDTKTVVAFLRKSAALVTQKAFNFLPTYFGPFDALCEVAQRQFAISCATSTKPVLATWHLAGCIAIAGFDKQHKVGFLFHVDEISDFKGALFLLQSRLQGSNFCFEYVMLGGNEESQKVLEEYLDPSFIKRPYDQGPFITHEAFTIDSYWSRAVRLCRSIAIDLTKDDPLANLMSYEAELNPSSVFHTRANTIEEADRFCQEQSGQMGSVWCDIGPQN